MIIVDKWRIGEIKQHLADARLIVDPEYQRRPVWSIKTQAFFIDSVARGIPVGALTIFEDDSGSFKRFEVIDGRQRLTALKDYFQNELEIRRNIIESSSSNEDDLPELSSDLAERVIDAGTYNELGSEHRMALNDYEFPVFKVTGTRAEAVRAFVRMNANLYSLKPQEIRNAVFNKTAFLEEAIKLSDTLTSELGANLSFLIGLGVITEASWRRMQDVQFCLECMILVLHGPQHRRDTIDQYCDLYRDPKQAKKKIDDAIDFLQKAFEQVWELCEGQKLQELNFPRNAENDLYALVGALKQRGLVTKTQMEEHKDEIRETLSEFRRQVMLYINLLREGEELEESYAPEVKNYAGTFLGGQINSETKRAKRSDVLAELINEVVEPVDNTQFTELQRSIIWARSKAKLCARCGQRVSYRNYNAGHKVPIAKGGRSILLNGQVEHENCNKKAGAK